MEETIELISLVSVKQNSIRAPESLQLLFRKPRSSTVIKAIVSRMQLDSAPCELV